MENNETRYESKGWRVYVKISFLLSVIAMSVGIYYLPADFWVKGYMSMGMLFVIGSSITAART